MCTIMTVSSTEYTREVITQIQDDAMGNPHGFALVLTSEGKATAVLRAMEISAILDALDYQKWDRMFLHCRWATQGSVGLTNTHGWDFGEFIVMHNGVLFGKDAQRYTVDSMAIGKWLMDGGVEHTLNMLKDQPFANVFILDTESGMYIVNHSRAGSLYTDYEGNYSTNKVGLIQHQVPEGYFDIQYFRNSEVTDDKAV